MIMDKYTKAIMTVIAVALFMIALNPWINPPEVKADVGGMDYMDLKMDYDFKKAVRKVVVRYCTVSGSSISC